MSSEITAVFDGDMEVVGLFSSSNKARAYISVVNGDLYGYSSFEVDELWTDEIHQKFNDTALEVITLAKDLSNE